MKAVPIAALFGWSPEAWIAVGTLALAFATVAALIFGPFWKWFRRARLTMEIRNQLPDAVLAEMKNPLAGTTSGNVFYLRIRVSHTRGNAAENVTIMATKLWRLGTSDEPEPMETFLPLDLAWSHVEGSTMRIPRKLFRFCDLGFFARPEGSHQKCFWVTTLGTSYPAVGNPPRNFLPPGRYEIELQLSGDNTDTIRKQWRLGFGSDWSDDEARLLAGLELEEIATERKHSGWG